MTLAYQYSGHADDYWVLASGALGLPAGAWGGEPQENATLSTLSVFPRNIGSGNVSRRLGAQYLISGGRGGALGTHPRLR